ncbi:MAG TPA: nitrogen assimilation transcriptional regulator NAC [Ramlibacter sp.]|uniref:nitrogen assimilation transcriptional regulator NAC n=1 Tax=Ramlibacter sp. TaxID=1917967 RepID=UPI002D0DBA82|nr:nitrogen assimilation transcriptional regulator NAC [Ramlibacter sp.]HVZ44906.1 nitrogen assimilation transcriptional regulator NAC [Ramlibacter sp.]
MNLRRLKYFVKIVDIGSLTQASEVLHIAQPALSQQIATLEGEFNEQLLVRTAKGVRPTEAGKTLYKHAQLILKQFEQARVEVRNASRAVAGKVSVGLAPGTAAAGLALPLLRTIRARFPQVLLHLNENFGTTLTDLIADGRMDMAVLYGTRPVPGLAFLPLLYEDFVLVGPARPGEETDAVTLAQAAAKPLLMLRPHNVVRRIIDEAFMRAKVVPEVIAELESTASLVDSVASGLGAAILPASAAQLVGKASSAQLWRICDPIDKIALALCTSDRVAPSPAAAAVKSVLLELAQDLAVSIGATQSPELEAGWASP